jgi:hypothetical protein
MFFIAILSLFLSFQGSYQIYHIHSETRESRTTLEVTDGEGNTIRSLPLSQVDSMHGDSNHSLSGSRNTIETV